MDMKRSQWLTEKHFLVCPKGVRFKQRKVNSQKNVRFGGKLAATASDTMIGNAFMCTGNLAAAPPPASVLQAKAVALSASPALGLPSTGSTQPLLAFASSVATMKCKLSAPTRPRLTPSTKLKIN